MLIPEKFSKILQNPRLASENDISEMELLWKNNTQSSYFAATLYYLYTIHNPKKAKEFKQNQGIFLPSFEIEKHLKGLSLTSDNEQPSMSAVSENIEPTIPEIQTKIETPKEEQTTTPPVSAAPKSAAALTPSQALRSFSTFLKKSSTPTPDSTKLKEAETKDKKYLQFTSPESATADDTYAEEEKNQPVEEHLDTAFVPEKTNSTEPEQSLSVSEPPVLEAEVLSESLEAIEQTADQELVATLEQEIVPEIADEELSDLPPIAEAIIHSDEENSASAPDIEETNVAVDASNLAEVSIPEIETVQAEETLSDEEDELHVPTTYTLDDVFGEEIEQDEEDEENEISNLNVAHDSTSELEHHTDSSPGSQSENEPIEALPTYTLDDVFEGELALDEEPQLEHELLAEPDYDLQAEIAEELATTDIIDIPSKKDKKAKKKEKKEKKKQKKAKQLTAHSQPDELATIIESEINLGYSLEQEVNNEKKKKDSKKKAAKFSSWLSQTKEKPQEAPKNLEKPKVEAKKHFFNPLETSKQSLIDNESIVTETLARVYEEQGLFEKAKSTYEKLALLFPEKSTYFARLIEKLDDNNNTTT